MNFPFDRYGDKLTKFVNELGAITAGILVKGGVILPLTYLELQYASSFENKDHWESTSRSILAISNAWYYNNSLFIEVAIDLSYDFRNITIVAKNCLGTYENKIKDKLQTPLGGLIRKKSLKGNLEIGFKPEDSRIWFIAQISVEI